MRTKALTLALLMFASALAGCFGEDAEDSIDSADDIIVDDRSGNETANAQDAEGELDIELVPTNPDDCNSGGGTWIEASERGGESYCDIDAEDVQRVVCELANETWIQAIHHDDEPCERGIDNDCDPENTHSHDHSHGGYSHTHSHSHPYFCDTDNQDVLDELKSNCEFMGGNWTSTNGTVERGDNSTNESWWECSLHDGDEEREEREITQEDCERRGGNWTAAPDRGDEYYYCDFGDDDREDSEEDREITQEDCERRNGTWTDAPDRPDEFYCDFDTDEDESNNNTEPEQPVDSDRDGVADEDDAFPNDPNETADTDGDGVGDNADACSGHDDSADADRDGTADGCDTCPNDADNDADRDGVCGDSDAFPNDPNETADTDGDGVGDNADQCADTPSDATVGEDGCEEVEPQVHFIDISGMAFSPNTLTISVGDTVTWTNQDGAPHSATGDNGEFDSGTLNNGQNFSFTFTAAGTYTYHCSVHNGMTATIIVE